MCFPAVCEEWEWNTRCWKVFAYRDYLVFIDTPLVLIRIVANALLWNLEEVSDVEAILTPFKSWSSDEFIHDSQKASTSTVPEVRPENQDVVGWCWMKWNSILSGFVLMINWSITQYRTTIEMHLLKGTVASPAFPLNMALMPLELYLTLFAFVRWEDL